MADQDTSHPEKTVRENIIFDGKLLRLALRKVQLNDGQDAMREIIKTRGAVVIVPVTANHEVRLVRQYRAAAETWLLELPAGTLEPGEDPGEAAPRELQEETGDHAETWHKLGGIYSAPGILDEYLHIYLATDLTPGQNDLEFDEHIEVLTLPWDEVQQKLVAGEINDAKTLAGLTMAAFHLQLPLQTTTGSADVA